MNTTTVSNKGAAIGLLALVGTVVIYLFGFRAAMEEVGRAAQQRADNQAKIAALEQKLSDLRQLAQDVRRQQDLFRALSVAMPADKQVAEIVTMVETMTARAGLVLENIQPASDATPEGLPVVLTVRGSFASLLTFAEVLEKNVRPVKIGPFNVTAGEQELSASFTVTFLYQVPPEDIQSTGVPEGTTDQSG